MFRTEATCASPTMTQAHCRRISPHISPPKSRAPRFYKNRRGVLSVGSLEALKPDHAFVYVPCFPMICSKMVLEEVEEKQSDATLLHAM